MKDRDWLISQGFTSNQINQIMMCNDDDLSVLGPEFDVDTFRTLRQICNDKEPEVKNFDVIVNTLANVDAKPFLDFLYNEVDYDCIDDFLWLLNQTSFKDNLEAMNEITKTKISIKCQKALFEIYRITDKVQHNIEHYDSDKLFRILQCVEDNKDYPVDCFKSEWNNDEIRCAMDLLDKEGTINVSLFELTNDIKKIELMNFLWSKGKKDYDCVLGYEKDRLEAFFSAYQYQPEILLDFYNSKINVEIFNSVRNCARHCLEYDFLLEIDNIDAINMFIPFYLAGAKKEDVICAINNFDKYDPKDLSALNQLYMFYETRICCGYINFGKFFSLDYDSDQRETLVSCVYQYKLDMTKYCDNRFMPSQIKVLAENKYHNRDIKKALDPSISPDKMEKIIFYADEEIDNIDDKNIVEDRNKFFEDFSTKFHQIMDGTQDDLEKIDFIDMCLDYNSSHEYQFDIEKCLKLVSRYSFFTQKEFDALLNLGDKSAVLFDKELSNNEFREEFQKLLIDNNIETDSTFCISKAYKEHFIISKYDEDYDLFI